MKIKSLLLGSAAVMVAVSGARAADVIVVEPEPVEYVRVCDAYGAGWFYIPGTETCLKFDGDVRIDYRSDQIHWDGAEDGHSARYRGRLNVRANNETQYGTLGSRIRFNGGGPFGGGGSVPTSDPFTANTGSIPADVYLDWAVISLAGFKVGYADDYFTTAGGYGHYMARHDGFYNYGQALFLDYTWAANGVSATVGIQSRAVSFAPQGNSGTPGAPDIYGGLTYSGGGWYLAGIVVWDNSREDVAYKLRADYDLSSIAPGLSIGGWWMSDDGDTDYVKGHAYGVTARMNLTDNLIAFGGYSQYADQDGLGAELSSDHWVAGVRWNVVSGLYIQGEYTGVVNYNEGGAGVGAGQNRGRFNLRIVRDF